MTSSSLDKSTVDTIIRRLVIQLKTEKENNGGRLPYKSLSSIVARMQPTIPWLNREKIRYHMRKIATKGAADGTRCDDSHCTAAAFFAEVHKQSSSCHSSVSSSSVSGTMHTMHTSTRNSIGLEAEEENSAVPHEVLQKSFGRPRGTTKANSRDLSDRVKAAMAEAALEYKTVRDLARNNGTRAKVGELHRIIKQAKSKHKVPQSTVISKHTILTRARRNRLDPKVRQGITSPMLGIEPYIVEVLIQLSKLGRPINVATGLQLANSIIAGTEHAARVLAWKHKHNAQFWAAARTAGKEPSSLLGKGYWAGFNKRNGHFVRGKRLVKFDAKRAEWCTHDNFQTMYDTVYNEMVTGGIAEKLDVEVMHDRKGETVNNVEDSFGLPTMYKLLHPEKLIFVDEVGSNTSQTKDGNVGGEKFLCEASARPQHRIGTKDSHFTVLGFTAATGEPVMCAIIFAAKRMDGAWALGLDPDAEWHGDEKNIMGNAGRGKRYPMGPSCIVNGITVPAYCCCSENGSITAELLVKMLSAIDELRVLDRSDGVPPFLLLDGHGSRFDLHFVRYINNPQTKWNVCIGVPYGTSYWQVGDSSEQNGCFKMALSKLKREVLFKKENRRVALAIDKVDIVDLVSRAWEVSFARVESNKKGIADRGWSPLNYNCLLHPEIQATQYKNPSLSLSQLSDVVPSDGLNLTDGLAATIMDSLTEAKMRADARNGIDQEEHKRQKSEKAKKAIQDSKRITAGVHFIARNSCIGPDVLHSLEGSQQRKDEIESEKHRKLMVQYHTLRNKVVAIRELNVEPQGLNKQQLQDMVKWYKNDNDGAFQQRSKDW